MPNPVPARPEASRNAGPTGTLLPRTGPVASRLARTWWLALAGALLLVLLTPVAAGAHAYLATSQPAAGQRLGTAPGVVLLTFSEPLASGSTATVTSPTGQLFSGTSSGDQILIPMSTNDTGNYQVEWTSVSALDGHVLTGSFTFGVGVARTSSKATASSGLARYGVALTAERAIEDTALLLAIGMVVLAGATRADPALSWVKPRVGLALLAAALAAVAVVTTEAFSASSSASIAALGSYLSNGFPGAARIARFSFEALGALVAGVVARPGTRAQAQAQAQAQAASGQDPPAGQDAAPGQDTSSSQDRVGPPPWARVALAISTAGAAIALAASGHAASLRPEWWGITLDAVHILAAGVWAGGILTLVTLRPPGGWRGEEGRRLLAAFSPLALSGFAATVLLGAIQALEEVGSVKAMFHTGYG
ncbi:MAG: copper resistance protein CopC, partial [Actinomycetota bacterium]